MIKTCGAVWVKNNATISSLDAPDKKSPRKKRRELFVSTPYKKLLGIFLFKEFLILAIELINATSAIDELHLTSIERV